ncbi:MAG TPA: hypothetical protein VGM88_33290 [Kofleriaceae bacterium]|jgi:hypothetical protein
MQLRLALLLLPLTACLDEAPPETAEDTAAVSGYGEWSWSGDIVANPAKLWSVGSNVCFLSGISGDFTGSTSTPAEADVSLQTFPPDPLLYWTLGSKIGTGTGTEAWGSCIPLSGNSGTYLQTGSTTSWAGTTKSQCYLQIVTNAGGLSTSTAKASVTHALSGSTLTWHLTTTTNVKALAICFENPTFTSRTTVALTPPVAGTTYFDLHNAAGADISTSGTVCGLTEISGNWQTSAPHGWDDGVVAHSYGLADWQGSTSAQRAGVAECLK